MALLFNSQCTGVFTSGGTYPPVYVALYLSYTLTIRSFDASFMNMCEMNGISLQCHKAAIWLLSPHVSSVMCQFSVVESKSATFPSEKQRHLLDDSVLESQSPAKNNTQAAVFTNGISIGKCFFRLLIPSTF